MIEYSPSAVQQPPKCNHYNIIISKPNPAESAAPTERGPVDKEDCILGGCRYFIHVSKQNLHFCKRNCVSLCGCVRVCLRINIVTNAATQRASQFGADLTGSSN